MAKKPKGPGERSRKRKERAAPAPEPASAAAPAGPERRSLAERIARPPREGTLARAARAADEAAAQPGADAPPAGSAARARRTASVPPGAPAAAGAALRRETAPRGGAGAASASASASGRTRVEIGDVTGRPRRPDVVLDPDRGPRDPVPQEAPPLLLLPLRLEYRFVTRGALPDIRDTAAILDRLGRLDRERGRARRSRRREIDAEILAIRNSALSTPFERVTPRLASREELWLRWYPDESFAENGVEPPTEPETAALAAFNARIGARNWWDMDDAEVAPAWQDFARAVGPTRAVRLKRSEGEAADPDFQVRIGRIAALPAAVTVFAVMGDGVPRPLVTGAAVPPNGEARSPVSYTPEAIEPGGWIADFEAAIAAGMGARLADLELVRLAKEARWIVAIGLSADDGASEVEALVASRIAGGGFGVLPQDSPTNNAAGVTSYHTDPLSDVAGFTRRATALERGDYAPGRRAAADLLAEAFGIDPAVTRRAIDGADLGYEDARAMLRVIGPALLDDALDGVSQVGGVDENRFIDVMAAAVLARGVLPAVRFGANAFGVLPMTRLGELDLGDVTDPDEAAVLGYLRFYASVARIFLPDHAEAVAPVIAPGDPEAADKLAEILKTNRVSTRVDVAEAGAARVRAMTCPYVAGTEPDRQPAAYLKALRTAPARDLPDPTAGERSWPLLYRLARITLTRNSSLPVIDAVLGLPSRSAGWIDRLTLDERERTSRLVARVAELPVFALAREGGPADALPRQVVDRLRTLNADFARALAHLEAVAARPEGTAELEVLMMEVIDLFQHRVDAFATGLAYARLRRRRAAGQKGLAAGYWGMLGRLRPESVTGRSDGYIQAPSMPQAVTAAVLRSAHLRHRGDGAFDIDHGSRRVRQALRLLDLIAKGHALGEGLGLRGERLLHDRRLDRLILPLRRRFPIHDQRREAGAARRMFDGRAFLDAAIGPAEPELQALQAALRDEFDALADIVVAEAAHQRALGLGEAANAWLQVLAGHPPPGDPVFLRTQRHGQASTHRVTALLAAVDPPAAGGAREIAEPALAALADRALEGFDACVVRLSPVLAAPQGGVGGSIDIRLAADLGMRPIDLVVGGASEVEVRARRFLLERALRDPAILAGLGAAADLAAFAAGRASFAVDAGAGDPSLATLADRAEAIRAAVQHGRPLEPDDLNAAADAAAGLLSEPDRIAMTEHGLAALRTRAGQLRDRLEQGLAGLSARIATFAAALDELLRAVAAAEPDAAVAERLDAAEAARRALSDALAGLAVHGEPSALRVFALDEAIQRPEATVERVRAIAARLAARRDGLAAALALQPTGLATLGEARAALDTTARAIQDALDGAAMPVLPPSPRDRPGARPALGTATPPAQLLQGWATVRQGVARAAALAAAIPGVSARPSAPAATADDADPADADPRSEAEAPRALHHAVFLGRSAALTATTPVAGIVCDEWAETRPSETQLAALAINYDSPQSEPPHCLLLAVPPNGRFAGWDATAAAGVAVEAIAWMQVRALSTDDRITPAALLPRSNQVAYREPGGDEDRRIPDRVPLAPFLDWAAGSAAFAVVARATGAQPAGLAGAGFVERQGFRPVQE